MTESATYPSLIGRAVFITGGGSGIGASLVRQFAEQGARVGFVDIDAKNSEPLVGEFADRAGQAVWYRCVDVADLSSLQMAIGDFCAHAGQVDVLVNNVANDTRHAPEEVTPESWRASLSVNLDPAFFAAQACLMPMRSAGAGAIINVSSINALMGPPDMPAYVAAKSAILGLTRALAKQYGPDSIRANTILPGWVATERQLKLWLTEEAETEWMKHVALKRRIAPRDIGNLALFLASDDSAMITAQHFIIDGGRT